MLWPVTHMLVALLSLAHVDLSFVDPVQQRYVKVKVSNHYDYVLGLTNTLLRSNKKIVEFYLHDKTIPILATKEEEKYWY
jgi:hypothetical protein